MIDAHAHDIRYYLVLLALALVLEGQVLVNETGIVSCA